MPIWFYIAKCTYISQILSSSLPEIDPDTAYVVCIYVSLGFRQKPSDKALLSVIALTTFNCIVSAPVTKGALVCFVATVHWWRHRNHYDVTEAYRALRNITTVHLNNGATCADLRGTLKHCEVTATAGRQSIYMDDFDAIFFITRYRIKPHSYSVLFVGQVQSMVTEGRAFGPRVSLDRWRQLAWQATSYKYGKIVRHQITVFLISKHSQRYYFWFNIWYVYVLDKIILCGYAIRSGRHPPGSQRQGPTCGRPGGRWLRRWKPLLRTRWVWSLSNGQSTPHFCLNSNYDAGDRLKHIISK